MKTSIKLAEPWGDCIDTVKYSKPLDEWYTTRPILGYNTFKLPNQYDFNLTEMKEQIAKLLESRDTISVSKNSQGEKFNRYRGLGFYSKKNSDNPLEDHFIRQDKDLGIVYPDDLHLNNQLPKLVENDFTETTDIMSEYFTKIFSVFKSKISKASLLELRPKGWLGSHVDFPYYKTIRLHASIQGNENAWYEIAGEKFQIPQDGSWYFIDTGKYHSIWNNGPSSRITLNVNLAVEEDPKILALAGRL
jgi:hypothetical protein